MFAHQNDRVRSVLGKKGLVLGPAEEVIRTLASALGRVKGGASHCGAVGRVLRHAVAE